MSTTQTYLEKSPNGRYIKYDDLIGKGSYKNVYKGFDLEEGKDVAWGEVSLEGVSSEELQRYTNEVELLRSVHCEYIVNYCYSWINETHTVLTIITQYMPSDTIFEYIVNKEVTLECVNKWCTQILKGLEYLHSREPPIVHKDLKCSNIFVDGTLGRIRIGDLGLASNKSCMDKNIAGTLEYMAPEVLERGEYSEQSDMYAFGMCMIELLTKHHPYEECAGVGELYRKVLSGVLPECIGCIHDEQYIRMIRLLLGEASKRPSAKELLKNPEYMRENKEEVAGEEENQLRLELNRSISSHSFSHSPKYGVSYDYSSVNNTGCEKSGDSEELIHYKKLGIEFDDNCEATGFTDSLMFSLCSHVGNCIRIKVIRKYHEAGRKKMMVLMEYRYGEEHIESIACDLAKVGMISEALVEIVTKSLVEWINTYILSIMQDSPLLVCKKHFNSFRSAMASLP